MNTSPNLRATLLILTALSAGCTDNKTYGTIQPSLGDDLYNYANPNLPDHFFEESEGMHGQVPLMDSDNTPDHNPTTDEGATLGRVLFYDTNLSQNDTRSCASCHIAELGFSDDAVLSEGFEGGLTGRHSMGLTNARFYAQGHFFWDQRAETLEDQVLMPLQDTVEMGMTLDEVVARVEGADFYPELFVAAFGDEEVTAERISYSLAQFVRSMVSTTSKYDLGRANASARSADFSNFTDAENRGKTLFTRPPPMGGLGCFVCHQGEGFIAAGASNNGLDATSEADLGYGAVTGVAADEGRFKVPSLRNVGLRAPYMHDGRFDSLEAVVNHYSEGVQPNAALGMPFQISGDAVIQLNLTDPEKSDLVAFLNTLSDTDMISDPKFSDPFAE